MKKEWFRRNLLWIIVVGEVIFACLIWLSGDWFFGDSRQTFGPLNSYIFIWLSIVIASIAALSSVRASDVASKSLELTRATTRPFLTIQQASFDFHHNKLILSIFNTGNLPADGISFKSDLFSVDSPNIPLNSVESRITTLFPNEQRITEVKYSFKETDNFNISVEYRFLIKIKYSSDKRELETSRTYKLSATDHGRQAQERLQVLIDEDLWE